MFTVLYYFRLQMSSFDDKNAYNYNLDTKVYVHDNNKDKPGFHWIFNFE